MSEVHGARESARAEWQACRHRRRAIECLRDRAKIAWERDCRRREHREQDDLASTILENSHQLPYDTEGRIVLPKAILGHANIRFEAVFVGRGNRFQIWEPSAYEIHNSNSFSRARNRGATLRLRAGKGSELAK